MFKYEVFLKDGRRVTFDLPGADFCDAVERWLGAGGPRPDVPRPAAEAGLTDLDDLKWIRATPLGPTSALPSLVPSRMPRL
jgi:hypothetical protein